MSVGGGQPSIGDDEILYRKIPVALRWYDPQKSDKPSPDAFKPHKQFDTTGISLDRARTDERPEFRTAAQAGAGQSPYGYYVAELRVGDLRAAGIDVVAAPVPGNPGHVELPSLRTDNRNSDKALELRQRLANELTLRVHGPF
jgi:hypothetical protein